MRDYDLSPEATVDLNEIWEYIADDNIEAADEVREMLFDAMDRLAESPLLGHVREDLAPEPLRFWPVRAVPIVYLPTPGHIRIVRVLSGYRDVSSLLG